MNNRRVLHFVIAIAVAEMTTLATLADLIDPGNLSIESNTLGSFDSRFDIDNAIDGSGLTPYQSSSRHDFVHDDNTWFSQFGTTSGTIVVDLGFETVINSIFVWNESDGSGSTGQEIPFIFLETSLSPNSGFTFTSLGSGLLSILPGEDATQDDPISSAELAFDPVTARYVRFTIPGGNGGNPVGLREIAFNAIPEPSSMGLLTISLAALVNTRKPRR